MTDFQKPVKVKHGLNSPKIRLSAPCPTAKGKFSNLSWDIYMNNPRLDVAVNDPSLATRENSFGHIQAAMDMPTFYLFLGFLKTAIEAEGEVKNQIKNYGTAKGAAFGSEPIHMTDVWVGKDAEGCVFISVVKKADGDSWPIIKFIFSAPDNRFVKVFKSSGQEYSKAELSIGYAKAYHELLSHAMGTLIATTYVPPPPFVPGNNGGKSWGGGGQGNGGGYQQRPQAPATSSDTGGDVGDSDMPF